MTSILESIGHTPLVELLRVGRGAGLPLLAKCEHLNPGGSVKDCIAVAIVADAEERGLLRPGATLIEATAGNTGIGLALVAAARGYSLVCVMPEKMSADKRAALQTLGARVIITPNRPISDAENFQNVAARLARQEGWFLTDQFKNPANVRAHETTTAREILEQTRGRRIAAFVAGAGTGGTLTGVGRALKRELGDGRDAGDGSNDRGIQIVLADPVGSGLAEWVRSGVAGSDGSYAVEGIGSSQPPPLLDRSVIDEAHSVSDDESFSMCRRLIREEGLLVGGSSGTAVVAALRVAARLAAERQDKDTSDGNDARKNEGDAVVVVLLADSWDRYLSCAWMRSQPA